MVATFAIISRLDNHVRVEIIFTRSGYLSGNVLDNFEHMYV